MHDMKNYNKVKRVYYNQMQGFVSAILNFCETSLTSLTPLSIQKICIVFVHVNEAFKAAINFKNGCLSLMTNTSVRDTKFRGHIGPLMA